MGNMQNDLVVVWGDSLGKGVVWNAERARYGYAQETAVEIVQNSLGCRINNRSRFGSTAPLGKAMMEKDLAEDIPCNVALLEYGGNDCNFDWARISENPDAQHLPNTTPEVFADTLREMVATLQQKNIRPILTTLPPIHPERYFQFLIGNTLRAENVMRWLGDVWQIYRFQEMYSLIISDLAKSMQVQLLDLRKTCLAVPGFIRDYLCIDGLHLNENGQRFVGEQLALLAQQTATV